MTHRSLITVTLASNTTTTMTLKTNKNLKRKCRVGDSPIVQIFVASKPETQTKDFNRNVSCAIWK